MSSSKMSPKLVKQLWRYGDLHTHTHTHNRLMAFVRDNPGRPVPEETCTRSHPSWSTYFLYHLSHLCSLKCHQVFFPYRLGLTSLQHAASHTTTIQPSSHNQRHILIGKQWYQLPELIPTNSNSGLHHCISISIHTQHVT